MRPSFQDLRPTGEYRRIDSPFPVVRRVKHGIAFVDHDREDANVWQIWERIAVARIYAVFSSMRNESVVVGPSALVVHRVPQWSDNPDVYVRTSSRYCGGPLPEVIVGNTHVPAVCSRQSRVPMPADTCEIEGVRVDSLANTAILMALTAHPLEGYVAACEILRHLSCFDRFDIAASRVREEHVRRELLARLDACGPRRGITRARAVLSLADAACENVAEAAALWVLRCAAPYAVKTQHEIVVDGRRYFCDFVITELKIIIEFDGMGKMGSTEEEFKQRRRELMDRQRRLESAGWRIIRLQWRDFRDFEGLRGMLARAFGSSMKATDEGRALWKPVPDSVNGTQRRLI